MTTHANPPTNTPDPLAALDTILADARTLMHADESEYLKVVLKGIASIGGSSGAPVTVLHRILWELKRNADCDHIHSQLFAAIHLVLAAQELGYLSRAALNAIFALQYDILQHVSQTKMPQLFERLPNHYQFKSTLDYLNNLGTDETPISNALSSLIVDLDLCLRPPQTVEELADEFDYRFHQRHYDPQSLGNSEEERNPNNLYRAHLVQPSSSPECPKIANDYCERIQVLPEFQAEWTTLCHSVNLIEWDYDYWTDNLRHTWLMDESWLMYARIEREGLYRNLARRFCARWCIRSIMCHCPPLSSPTPVVKFQPMVPRITVSDGLAGFDLFLPRFYNWNHLHNQENTDFAEIKRAMANAFDPFGMKRGPQPRKSMSYADAKLLLKKNMESGEYSSELEAWEATLEESNLSEDAMAQHVRRYPSYAEGGLRPPADHERKRKNHKG